MNARVLILLYLGLTLSPLVMAWLAGYPPRSPMDELASAAGLLAFAILLVEFVLSGRFRQVSSGVGMDITMRAHQLLARSCLVLALVHPFLYVSPRGPAMTWDVTRQTTINADIVSLAGGIVAFLLLPALVLLAIRRKYIDYRYESWRLMHGLGALVIAGALLHHALEAGRYSAQPVLAGFWIAMVGFAALSLVSVYLFRPLRKLRQPWEVADLHKVADRTWRLELSPRGHGGLPHKAGQFVWINVDTSAFSLRDNPFSIASAPGSGPNLGFVIKELGDFTGALDRVPPGTRAFVDGPYGHLTTSGRAAPGIAMIAGGVGIAPMLGLLRQKQIDKDHRPCVLIYGNRHPGQIVDVPEMQAAENDPDTDVIHVVSEPDPGWTGRTGMITEGLIRDVFDTADRRDWLYVLCGPPAMMESVETTLLAMGIPPGRILSERFDYD